MFDGSEDWCKIWRKTNLCFLKFLFTGWINTDFILESKIAQLKAELNWKQNLQIYFENCQDGPYSHE